MLIIANTLNVNGGTTFILRLAKEFASQGKKIGVLLITNKTDPALLEHIKCYADIYFLKDYVIAPLRWLAGSQLAVFLPYKRSAIRELMNQYQHTHVMGIFGLLYSALYIQRLGGTINLSVGIYHQNEFVFQNTNHYFAKVSQEIFKAIAPSKIVFFNEVSKRNYERFFCTDFSTSPVLPIGITLPDLKNLSRYDGQGRIVSVGNLVGFKTYNKHVISILPSLLENGLKCSYEIYGSGPEKNTLENLVTSLGLSEVVTFKGRIEYEKFHEAVSGAAIFIGSGTSLLEAAALGVPSLIGIESSTEPVTYGFLSDTNGYSYHEKGSSNKVFQIRDLIESTLTNNAFREDLANACKIRAEMFSISQTALGLQKIEQLPEDTAFHKVKFSQIWLTISFIVGAFEHIVLRKKNFANRRNQGIEP